MKDYEMNVVLPLYELKEIQNLEKLEINISKLVSAVEHGAINPLDIFPKFDKLAKIFYEAKQKIDEIAQDEAAKYGEPTFTYNGTEFTLRNPMRKFQYEENNLYSQKKQELKDLEKAIKIATETNHIVVSEHGEEIGGVSIKYTKPSLICKQK